MWSKVKVASMVNCWFPPAIWSCREGGESKSRPIAAVRLPVQSWATFSWQLELNSERRQSIEVQ